MPTYDYHCEACGLKAEAKRGVEVSSIPCSGCGQDAQRSAVYAVGVSGFAWRPYSQRGVPVEQVFNAQGDLLHEAKKQGKPMPDLWGMAQKNAKAILASGERL